MKKICAFLLACCIALLTVQPAASQLSSLIFASSMQSEGCCKAPDKTPQHAEGCCDEGSCNPFTTCACCASYVVTGGMNLAPRHPGAHAGEDYPSTGAQHLPGSFLPDCWRPPEIV